MIILHAGISDYGLLLWGEAPLEDEASIPRRRGRKPKVPRPDGLPYDAGATRLTAAITAAAVGFIASEPPVEMWIAWLPTLHNRAVASSPLIAQPPDVDAEAPPAPWQVTALHLSAEPAIDLLCLCMDKPTLAPGVIVGKDLTFWAIALRFAGALVASQRFLPGLSESHGVYRARWRPVFVGPDAERLARLTKAMPAACRALTREPTSAPARPAASVLSTFLGQMVDHLVRTQPEGTPRPPRSPERAGGPATRPAFDSVHDQWLDALGSPDGSVGGEPAELARLAAQMQDWQRPISLSTAGPLRLCFRLEEPEDEGDDTKEAAGVASRSPQQPNGWYVRYFLQRADDPSLLLPAADAWTAKGRRARLLAPDGLALREYLLVSLGQASGLCSRIEGSLKASAPAGYTLDANGAFQFLSETAWALEQAGFGVMLPAWWTRKGTKLRLTARANVNSPKMQGGSGLSLGEIVRFDWEIALGEEKLSLEELQALARLKAPLVKVRGQWVQMGAEEIRAALDFWKKKAQGQATVREIVQMALGATKESGVIALGGVTATGWIADLVAQLEGRTAFDELPVPDRFQGTLRPYQIRGYSWLAFLRRWGLGACLADDMGLGKTVQTLALIQRDWQPQSRQPVLLICPTSLVGNWQKEAARFTPELPVLVHHGLTRAKGASFQKEARKHAVVISSYALLHRDLAMFKDIPWAGVILDEAQNIKNAETKQSRAARSIEAGYRVALTGTPVENNVGDLWGIMEFLNPGFLGTQAEFKRTFFLPIQTNRTSAATEQLKRLTGPFVLRRLKTDKAIITDLPEKMEMKVFCTLTKEQASLYAAVVEDAARSLDSVEGIQRRGVVLATLSKLKQVCNHPAQFLGDNSAISGRSGKLARLTEMLEEILEVDERALVFSQFSEMGEILRRHLQETFGREVLFLHGGVAKKQRDRLVERFQADGDGPPIFLLSLKAGGTGLNLTRASHVFHFDRWWNPAVENQATDRAFRIGQRRNVQVHKFLCVGTLEEKIDEMIERKKEIAEQVVGTGESWLTELSTAQLKELFALRREAVGE